MRAALARNAHRAAEATAERMAALLEAGHGLPAIMERRLERRDRILGAGPTLADIRLCAYTHSAGIRGGFERDRFPARLRWLGRGAALPGDKGRHD